MDDCEMTDKNNCITGHTSRNTDSRRPTYHSFFMAYHFSSFTLPRSCISARWKIQSRNNEKNRNNQFSDCPKTQKLFRFESFTVFVTAGARQIWGTDIWKLQKVARDMNLLGAQFIASLRFVHGMKHSFCSLKSPIPYRVNSNFF